MCGTEIEYCNTVSKCKMQKVSQSYMLIAYCKVDLQF